MAWAPSNLNLTLVLFQLSRTTKGRRHVLPFILFFRSDVQCDHGTHLLRCGENKGGILQQRNGLQLYEKQQLVTD